MKTNASRKESLYAPITSQSKFILGTILTVMLVMPRAGAFSLIGPHTDWMTATNGFRQPGDIGGPMNLGEEYRWNVPVVTYAFDANFLDYFGSNGVAAVESAIQILNDLPPASQINPDDYSSNMTRVNFSAAVQGLYDLKSKALSTLVEQLGLAQPTRFAFCLHDFLITDDATNALVITRNFDPITWAPSGTANGTLLDYELIYSPGPPLSADAVEFPVDPLDPMFTAVADGMLNAGDYCTGLTRDDVGGLRYLLRTNNVNLETLLPDVHGTGGGSFVTNALRPGVDKITFVRVSYDTLLGQIPSPFTNQFTDSYIAFNSVQQQPVERVIDRPDILFSAGDTGQGDSFPIDVMRTGTSNWWNSTLTGILAQPGPGVIRPPVTFTFHKLGPVVQSSDDLPEGTTQINHRRWGSFDNSINPPVKYPSGTAGGDQMILRLRLYTAGFASVQSFTFQLTVPSGDQVALQTSTNLTDWVTLTTVANTGAIVEWEHLRSRSQRFFRVVPQ